MFVVWIAVLVELLLAETWKERVLEAGAFGVRGGAFGVLIIRSVLKEVDQKDRFKDLSERLESANTQLKQNIVVDDTSGVYS